MSTLRAILVSTLTAFMLVSFQNCSPPGQTSRDPASTEIQMNGGTTTDNPKATINVSIMPHSVVSIAEATICVEDVRFRRVTNQAQNFWSQMFRSSSTTNDELRAAGKNLARQLAGRDISISREGTFIDAFVLPRGDYNVVELVLDDDCEADKSFTLRNATGALSTKDKVTLRFDGNGSISESLQLNMQPVLEALSQAQSSSEIKRTLEEVRGTFQ